MQPRFRIKKSSQQKQTDNMAGSLFYSEFATPKSRGCFKRKLKFMDDRLQAI